MTDFKATDIAQGKPVNKVSTSILKAQKYLLSITFSSETKQIYPSIEDASLALDGIKSKAEVIQARKRNPITVQRVKSADDPFLNKMYQQGIHKLKKTQDIISIRQSMQTPISRQTIASIRQSVSKNRDTALQDLRKTTGSLNKAGQQKAERVFHLLTSVLESESPEELVNNYRQSIVHLPEEEQNKALETLNDVKQWLDEGGVASVQSDISEAYQQTFLNINTLLSKGLAESSKEAFDRGVDFAAEKAAMLSNPESWQNVFNSLAPALPEVKLNALERVSSYEGLAKDGVSEVVPFLGLGLALCKLKDATQVVMQGGNASIGKAAVTVAFETVGNFATAGTGGASIPLKLALGAALRAANVMA